MLVAVHAAVPPPSEVISDVSYIKKGGVRAIRVDFALPVHYVSHFPAKHGETLSINLRFNAQEVPDISQLPLLQSMTPPPSQFVPVTEVTYLTDKDRPKLLIKFSRDIKYSVSQIMGITSLVIFLPDTFKDRSKIKSDVKIPSIIPSTKDGKATQSRVEKMYRRGRRALLQADNRTAIRIFSSLLSIPEHKHSQESLELLGLARERNGQKAHAKAAYSEYVEKYKKGKDVSRVKQRLADLVVNRKKIKKRLKNKNKKEESQEYRSTFYAAFSQFVNYSESSQQIDQDEVDQRIDQTSIDNQLSMNWRVRTGNYDIRNFFYGNYDYDTLIGETDGFEVSSMYSKLKNSRAGVYVTLGRQSAQSTGVLSKFDGILLGYDLSDKVRFNVVAGFPVNTSDKSEIQTDKLFKTFNLEFNDLLKSWDISPYVYQQNIDGITNRNAIGTEIRFFHDNGDLFGLYDRDTFLDATNIVLLRGKYIYKKRTSIRVNYDKRRSPSLELERVLSQLDVNEVDTVGDIFDLVGGPDHPRNGSDYTLDELKQKAIERTGESKLITFGVSHSFSDVLHLTIDRTSSNTVSPTVTPVILGTADESVLATLDSVPERFIRKSNDFSFQFVTSQSFFKRDSTIISFRSHRGNLTFGNTLSLEYRWPQTNKLRINVRLQLRDRETYNDELVIRRINSTKSFIPSVKLNYRMRKNIRVYADFSFESAKRDLEVSNSTTVESYRAAFVGYTWEFL